MKGKYLVVLSSLLCLTACSGIYDDKDSTSSNDSIDSESIKDSTSSDTNVTPDPTPDSSGESSGNDSSETVDTIVVKSVIDNKSISDFETNKASKVFKVTDEVYEIGDDNAFNFKPEIKVAKLSSINDSYTPESWEYLVDLQLVDGENLVDVNINDNTYIETLDRITCKIDFSEAAIGKTFKFTVTPVGLTEKQQNNPTYKSIFELRVQDGYNVYNANELAYVNDGTGYIPSIGSTQPSVATKDAWSTYMSDPKHNLKPLEVAPKGIYIHKDLVLSKDDIPSDFYISQETAGTNKELEGKLLDNVEIYRRTIGENESFVINGNYFKLDASNLPVVGMTSNGKDKGYVYDKNKPQTSHAQLFLFDGDTSGNVMMKNINAHGNAKRANATENAGGLIFNKVESIYTINYDNHDLIGSNPSFEIYNSNCTGWFISFFPSFSKAPYKVNKCKATDSYNVFVYNYGSDKLEIVDCDMKGAGGPVILQDYVLNEAKDFELVSHTKIVDSNLESVVAGSEGWFKDYNVDGLVPQIKAIGAVMASQVGSSFLFNTDVKDDSGNPIPFFNLIAINKGGDTEGATENIGLKGTIEFVNSDETKDDAVFDYGATNPLVKAAYDGTSKSKAPLFNTSKGGLATFNGTNIAPMSDPMSADPFNLEALQASLTELQGLKALKEANLKPEELATDAEYIKIIQGITVTEAAINMAKGDKLCLYFNGMAIVTGYQTVKKA